MATINYNGMELEEFTSDKPVAFPEGTKAICWDSDKYEEGFRSELDIVAYIPYLKDPVLTKDCLNDYQDSPYRHCAILPDPPKHDYPLHPDQAQPLYVTIPHEEYDRLCKVDKEWKETVEAFQKAVMPMKPYYQDKFCPRCGKPLEDKRWRKFSEENPKESDYYLVTNGDFVDFEYGCYNEQDEEWNWDHNGKWKWWMPLPKLPEEYT